jgi:hypothetical protein
VRHRPISWIRRYKESLLTSDDPELAIEDDSLERFFKIMEEWRRTMMAASNVTAAGCIESGPAKLLVLMTLSKGKEICEYNIYTV